MALSRVAGIRRVNVLQNTDVLIAIGILCVLVMMVVPLPSVLIDIFIALNLVLGTVIILSTMYVKKATDLSVFPSLLLIATVYRLAIEVSTSRKILLGQGEELHIVKAFGSFVVGGNLVVGVVIFLILTIIQLLVIIRGTTRVSEVAARFTLDALPGKQMAIDAELNAGYITDAEARKRREEIRQEADFYGAMDGASRFVQGDVWAGLIITFINIVGGLAIGIIIRGETLSEAIRFYTTYTIGAALTAQIPAFLIAVATGILISRSASYSNLGEDMRTQLTSQPKTLFIAAGALLFLAILPGFPKLALIMLSGGLSTIGYIVYKAKLIERQKEARLKEEKEKELLRKPESVMPLLTPDPLELQVGYALIPLVDPESGSDLLDRISHLRKKLALELGIVIPPIRIRDNLELEPTKYVVKIRGTEVATAKIKPDKYLAIKKTPYVKAISTSEETKDPVWGTSAYWINPKTRDNIPSSDYRIVDAPTVLITHLSELIKKHADLLLTREDTHALIENLRKTYPTIVSELIPNLMTVGEVQKVLQELLREGVSIRDLVTILETLGDWAGKNKDLNFLVDKVREALSQQITKKYKIQDTVLRVVTISPELEEKILSSIKTTKDGEFLSIDPVTVGKMIRSISNLIQKTQQQPVILCSPKIRRYVKEIILKFFPEIGVLSFNEVEQSQIEAVGIITAE